MLSGRRFDPQALFGPFTPAIRGIVIVTSVAYVLTLLVPYFRDLASTYLVLYPPGSGIRPPNLPKYAWIWQIFSYLIVHGSPWHLVLNMLFLWMFGSPVESTWGSKRFLQYYLLVGIGTGVCLLLQPWPTMGASGAVFGVMVAFAMLFPDSVIYFMGLFPMKAMHLVILLVAVETAYFLGDTGGGVSNAAHLSGALIGFLYLKFSWRVSIWWKHAFGSKPAPRGPRLETRRPPARSGGGSKVADISSAPVRTTVPAEPARPRFTPEEMAIQKRADEILDKISREGMGSLSREEREILQKHSQILKQRDVVNLDDYRS